MRTSIHPIEFVAWFLRAVTPGCYVHPFRRPDAHLPDEATVTIRRAQRSSRLLRLRLGRVCREKTRAVNSGMTNDSFRAIGMGLGGARGAAENPRMPRAPSPFRRPYGAPTLRE